MTELDRRLRAAMERLPPEPSLPPGFAETVVQRARRRQRRTRVGAAAAVVAVVIGILVPTVFVRGSGGPKSAAVNGNGIPSVCTKEPSYPAKQAMAGAAQRLIPGRPASATLCRYEYSNDGPTATLTGWGETNTVGGLTAQLNKSRPGAMRCPSETNGPLVTALVKYPSGRRLQLSLSSSSCRDARNGSATNYLLADDGGRLALQVASQHPLPTSLGVPPSTCPTGTATQFLPTVVGAESTLVPGKPLSALICSYGTDLGMAHRSALAGALLPQLVAALDAGDAVPASKLITMKCAGNQTPDIRIFFGYAGGASVSLSPAACGALDSGLLYSLPTTRLDPLTKQILAAGATGPDPGRGATATQGSTSRPPECPKSMPMLSQLPKPAVPHADKQFVPGSPMSAVLCRYDGNRNRPQTLTGWGSAGAQLGRLVAQLNRTTTGIHSCPASVADPTVLAIFSYPRERTSLSVSLDTGPCGQVTNGAILGLDSAAPRIALKLASRHRVGAAATTPTSAEPTTPGVTATASPPATGRYPAKCPRTMAGANPPRPDQHRVVPMPATPSKLMVCTYGSPSGPLAGRGVRADAFAGRLAAALNSTAGTGHCTPAADRNTPMMLYFGYPGSDQGAVVFASVGPCTSIRVGTTTTTVPLNVGSSLWSLSVAPTRAARAGTTPSALTTGRTTGAKCPASMVNLPSTQADTERRLAPDGATSAVVCRWTSTSAGVPAHPVTIATDIAQLVTTLNDSTPVSPATALGEKCVQVNGGYVIVLHYRAGPDVVVVTRSCGVIMSNGIYWSSLNHPNELARLAAHGR